MANKKINGITVKIGGDTATLEDALKGVESTSKNLRSELREVNYSLKSNGDSAVLWEQKQELLSKAIEESREKVKILEEAQDQIKEKFLNHEIDDGQYRAFQRELENARYKSKELEEQLEEAGKQAENFGNDIQESGEKAEKSSDGYSVLKGALADLVAEGIKAAADAFKNCTEQAMEFETSIAKVNTIADGSVSIEKMEEDIMSLSNTTGIAAGDISNAVYDAISAGQRTEDAVGFVKNATDLARAGFADTGDALDLLTTILNAYGLESEKAVEVSDVLIQTQNLGKTTVGELSAAMGKVIPTANSCGVSLEQLAAAYAVMTSNGVATAETTTYINSMLNELSKSGTKSSDVLKEKTGKSFQELISEGKSLSDVLAIISEAAVTPTVDTEALEKAESKVRTSKINVENAQIKLNTAVEKYGENSSQAATAANNLEKAQIALQTAESDLNGMQEEQNKSFIDMWGSAEAGKAGLILLGDSAANYNSVLDQMKNSSGSTETALGKLNTKSHDLEIVQNKLKNTSIKAGKEILASLTPLVEKALPKVESMIDVFNKNLPKAIDTGKKLIPVAKGVGVAFAAWKLGQAAKSLGDFNGKIKDSGGLMKNLTGVISGNPFGVLAAGAGIAATAIDYFSGKVKVGKSEVEKLIEEQEAYQKAARDSIEEIQKLRKEADENAIKINIEYDDIQKKWDELQTLVDQNGKIKEGYEARVNYIVNELTDATGIEIELVDGQIQKYQELKDTIQKTIDKQRAQRLFSAYSENEAKYIQDREDAKEEVDNQRLVVDEAWKNYQEANSKVSLLEKGYVIDGEQDLGVLKAKRDKAKAAYDAEKETLDVFKEKYFAADSEINRLLHAEELIAEGQYNEATHYMTALNDQYKKTVADVKAGEDEKVEAYNDSLRKFQSDLSLAKESNSKANKESSKESVETVAKTLAEMTGLMLQHSSDHGKVYSQNWRNVVEELINSGIDLTVLKGYFEAEGIDLGEILGNSIIDGLSGISAPITNALGDFAGAILSRYNDPQPLPMFANGGFLPSGQGIVAEAGPELIEIMNGGAKITPLTGNARNTAVSGSDGNRSRVVYINNTINANVSGSYDVRRLAEDLAGEQRRVERNMGL